MKTELFETLQDFKDWQRMMSIKNNDHTYLIDNIKEPKKFPVIMVWYFRRCDEDYSDEYIYKYIYQDSFNTMKRFSFVYHNPFNIIVT